MVLKSAQVKQFQNLDANGGFCYPLDILTNAFAFAKQYVKTGSSWHTGKALGNIATCRLASQCICCHLPAIGTAHCQDVVKLVDFLVQSCPVIA